MINRCVVSWCMPLPAWITQENMNVGNCKEKQAGWIAIIYSWISLMCFHSLGPFWDYLLCPLYIVAPVHQQVNKKPSHKNASMDNCH